jgi:hypothetical protein
VRLVGDELPVDEVGQAPFQAAQRLIRCIAFQSPALVVARKRIRLR